MPLDDSDWNAIYEAISRAIPQHEIVYGRVVKRDEHKKLIWLKEFGDQPIPLVGFNGKVTVYDETATTTRRKVVKLEHEVPQKGDLVVVLRQMGTRRLGKCVGVVLSKGFVT